MSAPEQACDRCGGSGKIYVDDLHVKQCICFYRKALAAHLTAQFQSAIKTAKPVYDSPLYREPPSGEVVPAVDRTGDNLFLKGWWADLLGHFLWALGSKGPTFPFVVTTDERLRTVYVGSESYVARSRKTREDADSYNSLHDLIGPQHKLVILRLGFLGWTNRAAPGILLEALRIREVSGLATWVVEEPCSEFVPGHLSYSPEMAEYLGRNFAEVDLREQRASRESTTQSDLSLGADTPDIDRPLPTRVARADSPPSRGSVEDSVLSGAPRKRQGGFKKRGSGPLGDES
jgi:hypothetical protein